MATFYIVATPIGNFRDVTLRALETLNNVDLILCEDTRVSQKFLKHFKIKTKTLSYHQHSKLEKIDYILKILEEGKDLALISDAGTPGISDPGQKLINKIVEFRASRSLPIKIVPIPGPSAITAAASISGMAMDKFLFLGFPPAKRKRKKFFDKIINSEYPVIFYESPYRIIKTLKELSSFIPHRDIVIFRELTKKFETIYRGTIEKVLNQLKKSEIKGEFVVIIEGQGNFK